ncbi:MAG: nitroreductase family protein [Actinomycetota bacterium]|jgi:nitroreductase|nr:nitroreductase family protein [Actinomycetota bacterium]
MEKFSSLMDIIEKRKSIRSYKPQEVSEEDLNYVLEAFRKAPSAKNLQPWKLIVVRDRKKIDDLAVACNNQTFLKQAPVLIVACALENKAYGKLGGYMNSFPVDIGIAMEHLILAATEKGLGTCWIGAFNEKLVKDVLDIPDNVRVVALTPLGYPAEEGRLRGRKSLSEIVCYDRYTD